MRYKNDLFVENMQNIYSSDTLGIGISSKTVKTIPFTQLEESSAPHNS